MKRLLAIPAVVLLTLPLAAEETNPPKPAPKMVTEPAQKPAVESPLVAAARKTRRGSGKSIVITQAPEDYIKISSGLGEAAPTSIIVFPVLFEETVMAVIELASFSPFTEIQQTFLDQLSESIGVVLSPTTQSSEVSTRGPGRPRAIASRMSRSSGAPMLCTVVIPACRVRQALSMPPSTMAAGVSCAS